MDTPLSHRLLLRAYPRDFRDEFRFELTAHLAHQRAEPRYAARGLGAALFWWHAVTDAVLTGMKLRIERASERASDIWYGSANGSRQSAGGRGNRRRGVATMLETIGTDVRHALRGLLRSPGYALVFIVTLGLGIGANTAMFSAVNGVLLRPLPHEEGDRLVYLRHSAPAADLGNVLFSVPEVNDYRAGVPSLAAVAEFSALSFTMLGIDQPRIVRAGIVTGNYFEVLGLSTTVGHTIRRQDDGAAAPVMVLSDPFWRSVFAGDPGVIGRTVRMNGRSVLIVGIAEPAPPYPENTDVWVNMAASPHHLEATMTHERAHRMTEVFARLAPGATVESVSAEASTVSSRIHTDYPEAYDAAAGFQVSVTPLKTQLTSRARPTFLLLLGTAFLVLVIACANLANLALTRVLRREHELAIRISLGGTRAALRRELLAESLLLAFAGAGLGLLLAYVSIDLLVAFAARFTSRAAEISLDATVLAFTLLAALAASAFFAFLPALPGGDRTSVALTKSGARTTAGSDAKRAQRVLVVAQIATSFVLLIGAGLLLRTMLHLNRVDPGFDTAQILSLDIPASGILPRDDATRNRYMAILEDVRALPGVESAALVGDVPLSGGEGGFLIPIGVEGHQPMAGAPQPTAVFRVASADYFGTMGIDVLRGREFTSADVEGASPVVVINESMARHYFGERDPIGRRIAWTYELMEQYMGVGPEWRTVVGVVADTRDEGLDTDVAHVMYNPYPQIRVTESLVLRVAGDPDAIIPTVRETILAHDPEQPIENVATIEDLRSRSVAPRRVNAALLGSFAALALVIAAVGIGGVLAFSVGARTREFGVRSALGAAPRQIWSGVLGEGLLMAGIGVAIGAAIAFGVTRFIAGLLVGVPALDLVTFVTVGVLLAAVAVGASWFPAWRAARVSPVEALSAE